MVQTRAGTRGSETDGSGGPDYDTGKHPVDEYLRDAESNSPDQWFQDAAARNYDNAENVYMEGSEASTHPNISHPHDYEMQSQGVPSSDVYQSTTMNLNASLGQLFEQPSGRPINLGREDLSPAEAFARSQWLQVAQRAFQQGEAMPKVEDYVRNVLENNTQNPEYTDQRICATQAHSDMLRPEPNEPQVPRASEVPNSPQDVLQPIYSAAQSPTLQAQNPSSSLQHYSNFQRQQLTAPHRPAAESFNNGVYNTPKRKPTNMNASNFMNVTDSGAPTPISSPYTNLSPTFHDGKVIRGLETTAANLDSTPPSFSVLPTSFSTFGSAMHQKVSVPTTVFWIA